MKLRYLIATPILVVACPIRGHDRCRVLVEGPIRVAAGAAGVMEAAVAFARRLEGIVGRHPTQWFNFYDVWDGEGAGAPASGRPAGPPG